MLAADSTRAFYGPGHVAAAAEQGAIANLLIADSLYRRALVTMRSAAQRVRALALPCIAL
jgi:protein pelota